jgi:UDP:flavonoid glycosyltransferase YjiC (YdhE family)
LLAIGQAFADKDWDCIVLGHSDPIHASLVDRVGFEAISYPRWAEDVDPWADWDNLEILERSVDFDRQVLRRYSPSRVINDNRLSMAVACAIEGVPVVTICQDNQLPGFCYENEQTASIWIASLPAVNTLMRRHCLGEIGGDVRRLFALGRIAIPSSAELEPVITDSSGLDIVYTGILSTVPVTDRTRTDLLLYRTVGAVDDAFESAFASWEGTIFISTGDGAHAERLERQTSGPHMRVAPLWDLNEVAPGLRAVVHHGGHGITTACIAATIPSVILPGHNPERRANGHRAAALNLAEVLLPSTESGIRWGPAVDVTGDRPPWASVRMSLQRLLARQVSPVDPPPRIESAQLVEALT